MTRAQLIRQINTIVRKHKVRGDRRRMLPPAPARGALAARAGQAEIGTAVSV
jgi:hypothetical protein